MVLEPVGCTEMLTGLEAGHLWFLAGVGEFLSSSPLGHRRCAVVRFCPMAWENKFGAF